MIELSRLVLLFVDFLFKLLHLLSFLFSDRQENELKKGDEIIQIVVVLEYVKIDHSSSTLDENLSLGLNVLIVLVL